MDKLDREYDPKAHMIGNDINHHGVRVSAHYALGLLARGREGDVQRGCDVMSTVLDMQYDVDISEPFYGVFRRNDAEPMPATNSFPGNVLALFDGYKQNAEKLEHIEKEVTKQEEIIMRRVK